jgi:hypothetical protein
MKREPRKLRRNSLAHDPLTRDPLTHDPRTHLIGTVRKNPSPGFRHSLQLQPHGVRGDGRVL